MSLSPLPHLAASLSGLPFDANMGLTGFRGLGLGLLGLHGERGSSRALITVCLDAGLARMLLRTLKSRGDTKFTLAYLTTPKIP